MSAIAELGINVSQFVSGMNDAIASITNLKETAKSIKIDALENTQDSGKKGAIATLVAAVTALTIATYKGTEASIKYGSSLVDISYNAGVSVTEMMTLSQAMQAFGGTQESAKTAIDSFNAATEQAANGTGALIPLLNSAGVSFDGFASSSISNRIQFVINALKDIKHPTEQAQAAVAIFGAEGVKAMNAFSESRINSATDAIGRQAMVMQQSAGVFARITQQLQEQGSMLSEITAGVKAKLGGLFTGIASQAAPEISALFDQMNNGAKSWGELLVSKIKDLEPLGERIGKSIAVGIQAVRSGKVMDLFDPEKRAALTAETEKVTKAVTEANKTPAENLKIPKMQVAELPQPKLAISSLAAIGGAYGGGGATTAYDAQRENNRLTMVTNDLLRNILNNAMGKERSLAPDNMVLG